MPDMRSRRERIDDLMGGESGLQTFMVFVGFALLLGWLWLVSDVADNLPRLWRFLMFIISLLPGGDTPMFSPESRDLMILLAVVGSVIILWLLFKRNGAAFGALLASLAFYLLVILTVPAYTVAVASAANPDLSKATGSIIIAVSLGLTIFLIFKSDK